MAKQKNQVFAAVDGVGVVRTGTRKILFGCYSRVQLVGRLTRELSAVTVVVDEKERGV